MRNGGVAILGSATAEGEDRAQSAIEDAVNSPLLNDSEIRGAKWILVNITSAEGDYEITMDEEDTIMSYLRQEAGEDADVIKGIGFDDSLGAKVGVTIIATGFDHKDPFKIAAKPVEVKKPEDKIILHLGGAPEEKKTYTQPSLALEEKDPFAPVMIEQQNTAPAVIQPQQQYYTQQQTPVEPQPIVEETTDGPVYRFELQPQVTEPVVNTNLQPQQEPQPEPVNNTAAAVTGSSLLSRPSNIYAKPTVLENPQSNPVTPSQPEATLPELELKLVMKEESPEPADVTSHVPQSIPAAFTEDPAMHDDVEDQKRRAQERIQKLRNLSFNMSNADTASEFETVPAYIRRNMELFGTSLTSSAENFYSKYTVKPDENDKGQISSINTFLDGKKPD